MSYCLETAGVPLQEVEAVVYYEKPLLKFDRLLETYLSFVPGGVRSFRTAMPVWLKEKLYLKTLLRKELAVMGRCKESALPSILFSEHHQAHAASAFFPSPFQKAAVLCIDGVGEWATTSVWLGEGNTLVPKWQLDFPHSLGLLYSSFAQHAGFKVNSGEYKLMGLAPYGSPRYVNRILEDLIELKEDGTFRLNMKYFNFAAGLTMTNQYFDELFGGPPRKPEAPLTQREMDLARSIQEVTEDIVMRLAKTVYDELGTRELCLAGGVALNCVANGRLLREGPFRDIWIQPAAGDAGGALGAALAAWHQHMDKPRRPVRGDSMQGSYLGPLYTREQICSYLDSVNASYLEMEEEELLYTLAELLAQGKIIGWFHGRMEFGPRALGGRSILGDSRNPRMHSLINRKIKFRESFRPVAPSVPEDDAADYFEIDRPSPYMLLVAYVRPELRTAAGAADEAVTGIEKINLVRSSIPAVTHLDYSARVQTVNETLNPRYYRLLKVFKERTGCSVVINTSFNVRGEPIVCSPQDAYRCFMRTEMDCLALEDVLLEKHAQPDWQEDEPGIRELISD